jgi:hypothetical protein
MTATASGNYVTSEMRKYLSALEGVEASGCFLAGLVNAGISGERFWAPRRMVTGAENEAVIVEDTVWLPTERESGRTSDFFAAAETAENQEVLEWYAQDINNGPWFFSTVSCWLASSQGGGFLGLGTGSGASRNPRWVAVDGSTAWGVLPAFCVK